MDMKKAHLISSTVGTILLAGSFIFVGAGVVQAENNYSVAKAQNDLPAAQTYRDECAACHMAYAPSLLPARSWTAILNGLEDHFGEYAVLDDATVTELNGYLTANAGDVRRGKFMRGLAKDVTPLRITDLPAYIRKHDEIPDYKITGNPEVGSLSQCQACHGSRAEQGFFDEDNVRIPGFGREGDDDDDDDD
jgi:mono/diheme cytochrome c family protein